MAQGRFYNLSRIKIVAGTPRPLHWLPAKIVDCLNFSENRHPRPWPAKNKPKIGFLKNLCQTNFENRFPATPLPEKTQESNSGHPAKQCRKSRSGQPTGKEGSNVAVGAPFAEKQVAADQHRKPEGGLGTKFGRRYLSTQQRIAYATCKPEALSPSRSS